MSYFIFKEVLSTDLGLIISSSVIPPTSPEEYEIQPVPGRDVPLWIAKNTRQTIEIQMQTVITDPTKLRTIYSALQGRGNLVLSDEPDKYYVGSIQALIPQAIALRMGTLPLSFICEPFAYSLSNDMITSTEHSTSISVSGTAPCLPIVKIYGSGYNEITINDETWKIADINEYVTIDSPRNLVYKDNAVLLNKVSRYDNKVYLPMFNVGTNLILTTDNISKIEVIKNERWL